ncbi:hypothetical protein [Nocardiopsis dassonvillei]
MTAFLATANISEGLMFHPDRACGSRVRTQFSERVSREKREQ